MSVHSFLGLSEPVSSLTHFIGAFGCVALSVPMWRSIEGKPGHRLAIGIFCVTSVILLSVSGLYHLLSEGPAKDVLQRLDHAVIFLMIAATFTPIHVILFKGKLRWVPLAIIWTLAVIGIVFKTILFHQISEVAGTAAYLGMGWLGIISGILVFSQSGFGLVVPLLDGMIFYSVGSMFEILHAPVVISGIVGPHELFHVFVLLGIAYHWRFVRRVAASSKIFCESAPVGG